jgi:hypothetical protein
LHPLGARSEAQVVPPDPTSRNRRWGSHRRAQPIPDVERVSLRGSVAEIRSKNESHWAYSSLSFVMTRQPLRMSGIPSRLRRGDANSPIRGRVPHRPRNQAFVLGLACASINRLKFCRYLNRPAAATWTTVPVVSESDGLTITLSDSVLPLRTSEWMRKSRATLTSWSCTTPLASNLATCRRFHRVVGC